MYPYLQLCLWCGMWWLPSLADVCLRGGRGVFFCLFIWPCSPKFQCPLEDLVQGLLRHQKPSTPVFLTLAQSVHAGIKCVALVRQDVRAAYPGLRFLPTTDNFGMLQYTRASGTMWPMWGPHSATTMIQGWSLEYNGKFRLRGFFIYLFLCGVRLSPGSYCYFGLIWVY